MGGLGSGRHGNTVTAEAAASYVLNISSLAPAFQPGQCVTCIIRFDRGKNPVVVTVDLTTEWNCFVESIHKTRDYREGDRIVTARVELTWTTSTYGGRRWWFICPRTADRTSKLFLPRGGLHFWSRQAYPLGYACQREDRFSRLQRRASALDRQFGGDSGCTMDNPPTKPKWMRWRTYERKLLRWERAVREADEEFTRVAMRIAKRPP